MTVAARQLFELHRQVLPNDVAGDVYDSAHAAVRRDPVTAVAIALGIGLRCPPRKAFNAPTSGTQRTIGGYICLQAVPLPACSFCCEGRDICIAAFALEKGRHGEALSSIERTSRWVTKSV